MMNMHSTTGSTDYFGVAPLQVGYDGAGRQVYYTIAAPPAQGGMVGQYKAVAMDGRQGGGGALNQEGKVVVNSMAPQTSFV
ncbi:hypothetical protein Q3G72_022235 [Acer saccharum]|nr:hypothetical protein Q3G72_022235 [Acer saccharum]